MARWTTWIGWAVGLTLATSAVAAPQEADEHGPTVHTSREGARVLPLPKEEGVFHFVVYGDRTGGPAKGIEVLRQAVADTNLLDPDLVMTVGDLIQGYNQTPKWLTQMKEYRGVMGELRMPWYPVAGNHDVYWRGGKAPPGQHEGNYEEHFGPLWYWFAHKNAAFVVLYSDEGDPSRNRKGWGPGVNRFSERQLTWLKKTLAETKGKQHVFVFLHHPRWITDYYKESNWDAAHELLAEAGNVSAVFAGHIHRRHYAGKRDGIEYLALAATGGGMLFNVAGTGHLHHLDVVTVREKGFSMATVPVGTVLDPRDLTPERWKEIDALRRLPFDAGKSRILVDREGRAAGKYTLSLANPTSRPIEINVENVSGDPSWWFTPDHHHVRLDPGTEEELTFGVNRDERGGFGALRLPRVAVQIDYLAEDRRVSLPERRLTLRVGLDRLPAEVFDENGPRAMAIAGGGHLLLPSAELDLPDGPFTVEGWLRAKSYGGRRAFIAKTEESEFGIFVSGGKPGFSVFLGKGYVTAEAPGAMLEADKWHHLAGVYDGKEVRLYVDGKQVASKKGSGKRKRNRLPLIIGGDVDGKGNPTSRVTGWIDEVRISTGARHKGPFEPSRRFEPDKRTVLLLHLDRGLGPFGLDHSPNESHALRRGPVEYVEVD